jgi:hypothetical protein
MITPLEPHQIFVFGSNSDGIHAGGAARQALEWGAVIGIGHGLMGQTYAIDTMSGLHAIYLQALQFKQVAELLPDKEFLLTPVGTGIAGYTEGRIAPFFESLPSNVTKVGWSKQKMSNGK